MSTFEQKNKEQLSLEKQLFNSFIFLLHLKYPYENNCNKYPF